MPQRKPYVGKNRARPDKRAVAPEDIGIRFTLKDTMQVVLAPSSEQLQATLNDDVKRFAVEWLAYMQEPIPPGIDSKSVSVEFVAYGSAMMQHEMHALLEWIFRHPQTPAEIKGKISEHFLRSSGWEIL